jgi:hypothetical protein
VRAGVPTPARRHASILHLFKRAWIRDAFREAAASRLDGREGFITNTLELIAPREWRPSKQSKRAMNRRSARDGVTKIVRSLTMQAAAQSEEVMCSVGLLRRSVPRAVFTAA